MAWNFQRTEQQFQQIPVGDHRVVIESAEKATSKNGNEMLVIKMKVSGYNSSLWEYITFLPNNPEITNRKLTQLFDSFAIEDGNFNLASYVGKAGAVHVKIDEQGYSKVAWFIHKNKQDNLPPWMGDVPTSATSGVSGGFQEVNTDDCPW